MTKYAEQDVRPAFITRMRRLSKSNFTTESQQKSPRLDKMIAHVNLFDKTTKCIEENLTKNTLAPKSTHNSPPPIAARPGVRRRTSSSNGPDWIADVTTQTPVSSCVVVTELSEDMDDD